MRFYKWASILLVAHIISVNWWFQSHVGELNLVLVSMLLLSIFKYVKFDLYQILSVGIIQDILSLTPLGWYLAQLMVALILFNALQKIYLSFSIRNYLIQTTIIIFFVQLTVLITTALWGQEVHLLQLFFNGLFCVGIMSISIIIFNRYSLKNIVNF